MRPALSIRQGAASTMAGAIFMSNTVTRDQCFQAGVFGLPMEYESFVHNVRKGMPLFLFDYNLRKLYGVFEAASDGGLNINRDAFQRAYPAQVRVSIIWKCRPLSEDEFSSAIEENYYQPRKFYFDLSYEQVVCLFGLFDGKRVGHSVQGYWKNECLGTQDLGRMVPDKRSLTPNASQSDDQSHLSNSDTSAIVSRYSSLTNRHPVLPPSVEVQPSMILMPLETENFGTQIALMHNHDDQTKFPCQSEHLQATSITTRPHQLAGNRSYPLDHNYPHKVLSSGRIVQDPTEEAKILAYQFYPSSHDFAHNNSISSNPTYGDRNHMSTNSTPYMLPYPASSLENPQDNSEYQEDCEICIRQRNAHNEMYMYEHQPSCEGKTLPAAEFSQQGIPAYHNIPEFIGKTISAVDHQKNGSASDLSLSDFGINFKNDMGVAIGAERNTIVSQSNVFSRISPSQQSTHQEATGPTLSELVSSFSQKAKKWSDENGPLVDGVYYTMREQAADRPYAHSELNPPSKLEMETEAGETIESQPPFLNFRRRSEAQNANTSLGKEISGKVKKRKLLRPSFEENSASTSSITCKQETKLSQLKVGGNHFDIDLNTPATVDSDPQEKDNSIEVCLSVLTKIQTEKLLEVDANKTNSKCDEKSELQTLLHALGKFASAKLNSFEEARSSISGEL